MSNYIKIKQFTSSEPTELEMLIDRRGIVCIIDAGTHRVVCLGTNVYFNDRTHTNLLSASTLDEIHDALRACEP